MVPLRESIVTLVLALVLHAMAYGSILALAAQGEVLAERAGVVDLGVEGLMALGAVLAVIVADATHSPWAGCLAAAAIGAAGAAAFGCATVILGASQTLCGVALTLLGLGASGVLGHSVAGRPVTATLPQWTLPGLSSGSPIGPVSSQGPMVWIAFLILPLILHVFLFRTAPGLALRAVGEAPASADASGLPVIRIRMLAVSAGGALAGLAGAAMTLSVLPVWSEGMIAGRGWIAVALVILCGYRPVLAALSSLFFGFVMSLGFFGQAQGWPVAPPLMNMSPYVVTILCMIVPSILFPKLRRLWAAPAALGAPYRREER
ncbi:inner-membrane translocator [Swaminathania salitolerans LMG 21291]|uniref:ABC transporter permease n=1 Tax=Swaminathania salitolerans TaxID=182838 RepID=A0A511BPD3_9PROT|nr:inner-membrane translocator [Swaminathania salitolerans LMG 21291]GEL01723.1 ABC transporter permease [Swaminathania salitolerans]